MKHLLILFAAILYLVSCTPQIQEQEPDGWDFPGPEGLFVFHDTDNQGRVRAGLIDELGEVILPFEYDHISILRIYDAAGLLPGLSPDERFFIALSFDDAVHDLQPGWALISPEGSFLTGFDYAYIGLMPSDPTQIIARRTDSPENFIFLDSSGEESYIENEQLIYTLTKYYSWLLPREEWWRFGPDIPEQGFEWTSDTLSGNFWGAVAPTAETAGEEQAMPEIRLYTWDGFLVNNNVYHFVEYIGDGLYMAVTHTDRSSESFIVNYNGRRLAGPYESFYHHPEALPFLLGVSGGYANVLSTDNFRELRAIHIPRDGRIELVGRGLQSFVAVSSRTLPLTLVMLGRSEEITFEDFVDYELGGYNAELDRFVLIGFSGPEYSASATLVDELGNILALGQSLHPQLGYIVASDYFFEHRMAAYFLLDWDGNELIPAEFDHLEVLPGNALLAVQGERIGIIDLGGNWIF